MRLRVLMSNTSPRQFWSTVHKYQSFMEKAIYLVVEDLFFWGREGGCAES